MDLIIRKVIWKKLQWIYLIIVYTLETFRILGEKDFYSYIVYITKNSNTHMLPILNIKLYYNVNDNKPFISLNN